MKKGRIGMNIPFLIALGLYLLLFVAVAVMDRKRTSTLRDYITAGKSQGAFAVTMTLLATMIGASATIGVTDTVRKIGFPGIWWLLFGALGLILQSFFLSERVRRTGADTLPDLAGIVVERPRYGDRSSPAKETGTNDGKTRESSRGAELLLALVIVISWIGVIAGQFAAMNSLLTLAVGRSCKTIFILVGAIVILYTMLGGQLSVVRTDRIQLIIILLGIVFVCGYLYIGKGTAETPHVELLNTSYRPMDLFTQFFVIGGVYFLGPDILSRNFISKDARTAKRSALVAGFIFSGFAVLIALIGMWVRINMSEEALGGRSALLAANDLLPAGLSVLLLFALLSAILSSTDTCIINASAIFVKNVLKKDSVMLTRITVSVIGGLSLILVVSGSNDIMSWLSGAYSVYTPGVIFPLTVAILVYRKREIRKSFWYAAVIEGGLCGIMGNYFPEFLHKIGVPSGILSNLTLIGMGLSLVLALLSIGKSLTKPSTKTLL